MPPARLPSCVALLGAIVAAAPAPPTVAVPPASPHAAPDVTYTDVTRAAGLSGFRHVSGSPGKPYILEVTGSGVAAFDYDLDGLTDIYLVNGSTLDRLRGGEAAPRAALFRNHGDGRFRDVTLEAAVPNERWGQGVCAGDFDNDGFPDLYVSNFGVNRLYRGSDSGRFTDVADRAGVAVDGWSTGCAFGDFDGDGWLDLYVAGYIELDLDRLPPAPPDAGAVTSGAEPAPSAEGGVGMGASYTAGAAFCTYRGEPVMCGPRGLNGAPDHLFRNNGDGTFTDVTRDSGLGDADRLYGFGVAWFDMDDDGRLDLIVANDSGPNHVFRNAGGGRFEDISYPSGAALDGSGRPQAHMGVAIGDYDNDGRDDIHITNFADDFNVLYHNDGGSFSDVSYRTGIAHASIPFLGWGTDFLDYDNDGWLDLLVVNGHVYPSADRQDWNTSYAQRSLLLRNFDGRRFADVGAAAGPPLTTAIVARGSAVADFDNDGGLDIVVNTLDGPPVLARNTGEGRGHWIMVQLRGDPARRCPRDGIGSVVSITAGDKRLRREVSSGRGQISQSDPRLHFGLGPARKITSLEVRWANGSSVSYPPPPIDRIIVIDQAKGVIQQADER